MFYLDIYGAFQLERVDQNSWKNLSRFACLNTIILTAVNLHCHFFIVLDILVGVEGRNQMMQWNSEPYRLL